MGFELLSSLRNQSPSVGSNENLDITLANSTGKRAKRALEIVERLKKKKIH